MVRAGERGLLLMLLQALVGRREGETSFAIVPCFGIYTKGTLQFAASCYKIIIFCHRFALEVSTLYLCVV